MEIVKPKLDVVFKALFTKNLDLLKCFVADIVGIPRNDITDLSIDNPNVTPNDVDGKQSQLDLKLSVDDKIINVEIQLSNKGDFPERSLYYWAKIYSDELRKSEYYSNLKRTICINIVDFDLFKERKDPYSRYLILEENSHELLTDKFAILFLELPKIDSEINKNDHKKLWMQFLKAETEEELDMLNETNVPEIQKAVNALQVMSGNDEMREIVRLREKAMYDEKSALNFARRESKKEGIEEGVIIGREEGRKEGEAKGIEKQKNETIAKMRSKGYTEEEIRDLFE